MESKSNKLAEAFEEEWGYPINALSVKNILLLNSKIQEIIAALLIEFTENQPDHD